MVSIDSLPKVTGKESLPSVYMLAVGPPLECDSALVATGMFFAKTGAVFKASEFARQTLVHAKDIGQREGLDSKSLAFVLTAATLLATNSKMRQPLMGAVACMTKMDVTRSQQLAEFSELPESTNETQLAAHRKNYSLGLAKDTAVFLDAYFLASGLAEQCITNSALGRASNDLQASIPEMPSEPSSGSEVLVGESPESDDFQGFDL